MQKIIDNIEVYEQEDSYVIKANYKLKLTDKLVRDLANMFNFKNVDYSHIVVDRDNCLIQYFKILKQYSIEYLEYFADKNYKQKYTITRRMFVNTYEFIDNQTLQFNNDTSQRVFVSHIDNLMINDELVYSEQYSIDFSRIEKRRGDILQ